MKSKTKQYTIRNIPEPVDRYLRKRAKLSNKSLNQVVIEELSTHVGNGQKNIIESLDWFIGSGGIGDDVIQALEEDDKAQKELTRKQWQL
ncbi:hypothetical protein H6801_04550 [Candidatus Nomurabacteria bacterium]|nr:hypothetical protein [Candidatus Nomurabacteria bacterium]